MVIDDLHVVGIAILPVEADTPLLVDPDAVLSPSIPFQGFEAVTRRYPQIVQGDCAVEYTQLPPDDRLDSSGQAPGGRPIPDSFRFPVGEIPDHHATITQSVI